MHQFFSLLLCFGVGVHTHCTSPQYSELFRGTKVVCSFDLYSYDLYWYTTVDKNPIVKRYVENGVIVVSGSGYTNGSYDIDGNGSLIIRNVTDDRTFIVLQANRADFTTVKQTVELRAVVTPSQHSPTIEQCEDQNSCVLNATGIKTLGCTFSGARPAADLRWYKEIHGTREEIDAEEHYILADTYIFKSSTSIDVPELGMEDTLTSLICEASGPALGSKTLETHVLIDTFGELQNRRITDKYCLINNRVELPCDLPNEYTEFIWEKTASSTTEMLTSSARTITEPPNHSWYVTGEGSLVLKQVDIASEGIYTCKRSDGVTSAVPAYALHVLVPPSPPFIMAGCPKRSTPCNRTTEGEPISFEIVCAVHEIYPNLSLTFENNFPHEMTVFNQRTSVAPSSSRYDITLSAELKIDASSSCGDKYIRCIASGPGSHAISTRYADIDIMSGECNILDTLHKPVYIALIVLAAFWAVISITAIAVAVYVQWCNSNNGGKKRFRDVTYHKGSSTVSIAVPDHVNEACGSQVFGQDQKQTTSMEQG